MTPVTTAPATPDLLTVQQFCERHKWARAGGIRHMIFHADKNGLADSGALVRFGRKLLLDEVALIAWMRQGGTRTRNHKKHKPAAKANA